MTEDKKEDPTISLKLRTDTLTDVVIKEANLHVIAFPLTQPRFTVLGFLWSVINTTTTFYDHVDAHVARNNKGIVKAGLSDMAALGKRLTGR